MSSKTTIDALPSSEHPKLVILRLDPANTNAHAKISKICYSGEEEPESDRLSTLVLPRVQCSERDQTLGAYLAAWNQVEAVNDELVSRVLGLKTWEAAPITALGLNVSSFSDMVLGLGERSLNGEQLVRLSKYLDCYKVRNTKRNRIVHGKWICEFSLGSDSQGAPYTTGSRWLRIYTPQSAKDRKKLYESNLQAIGKYSFSIPDLVKAICEVTTFLHDFSDVVSLFPNPHLKSGQST